MEKARNKVAVIHDSLGVTTVLMLMMGWLTMSIGVGQTAGTPTGTTGRVEPSISTSGNVMPLVDLEEDYRIGVNDVIEIQIEDASELSGSYRIAKSGTFLMPFLGRITAQHKTPEELAKFITDSLRDRYLNNPTVRVVVRQYNSRSFFIQGAVRSPGVYQVEGKPSLLVLLTLAGGLAENHSSTAFILRPNKQAQASAENSGETATPDKERESAEGKIAAAQNEYSLLRVNVSGLLVGRFEQNMYLEPGDIVNVPQSEIFFVAGEVQKPGAFAMREGTTLRHAISLAQGVNFKADMKRGIIFREDPGSGKKKEINIDVAAVMNGKNEDIPILPNDIVYIPNSKIKTIAAPLLQGFGTNAIIRMPIY